MDTMNTTSDLDTLHFKSYLKNANDSQDGGFIASLFNLSFLMSNLPAVFLVLVLYYVFTLDNGKTLAAVSSKAASTMSKTASSVASSKPASSTPASSKPASSPPASSKAASSPPPSKKSDKKDKKKKLESAEDFLGQFF